MHQISPENKFLEYHLEGNENQYNDAHHDEIEWLELALGLHLANNVISSLVVTHDASALQTHALFKDMAPTASHMDTVVMLACGIIFLWICNRKYKFFSKINLWGKVEREVIE